MSRRNSRRTVVAQFAIPQLPGIQIWWRADTNVTLNAGNVSHWVDRIQGIDMPQATAGSQPPLNTADPLMGNQPTIVTTTGKQLGPATFSISQPDTIILFGYNANSPASGTEIFGGSTARQDFGKDPGGEYIYAGSAVQHIASGNTDNNPHAFCALYNGASSSFYLDDSTNPTTGLNPGPGGLNGPTVSVFPGAATSAVAEIIICSGLLSASSIAQVFRYGAARYGQTWH